MILFGPAGNDDHFYEEGYKSTIDAPKWVNNLGLNAYEYSLARGTNLSDETALKLKEAFNEYNIKISVHAPYYINFACPEEQVEKSYNWVIQSAKKVKLLGGNRVIVHPASCGKLEREEAVKLTKQRFIELSKKLTEENLNDVLICIETMGKSAQIGTYQEVVDFCSVADNFIPTFDFGHINALTQGSLKTQADYEKILKYSIDKLGIEKIKHCHIHFSKIEYSLKGEIKHLTLEDETFGPEFLPLAKALKALNLEPVVICESKGLMAYDAAKLKQIYENA